MMSRTTIVRLLLVLALAGCATAQKGARSYYDVLKSNPSHSWMMQIVDAQIKAHPQFAGLIKSSMLPLTIYAPTDAAFTALMKEYNMTPAAALKKMDVLSSLLTNHVSMGSLPLSKLNKMSSVRTMYTGPGLTVNKVVDPKTKATQTWLVASGSKAKIVKADQKVTNAAGATVGVVHDIDYILLPISKQALQAKLK